ncbi:unnamed protein product [Dovyalis caffra]|uniref:Cyclin C-terminal domain-containing protein n=1 Tax=Dovyalis caffra TaxID=77055 RepID=A0AAV1RVH2_9ROSI|nr:unnamed protein product [Dovyalis caffra]
MADFQSSSHKAKWIFTPQQLAEKYKSTNQRAKQMLEKVFCIALLLYCLLFSCLDDYNLCLVINLAMVYAVKYGTTRLGVDVDGSLSYPEPQVNTTENSDKHSRSKPLSVEEEQFMRVYYEYKLREATALIYFKRFYLQWLTCIYASCKIEENHVSAEELGKGISQDHQMILNYEMISLEFDLIVYAPYRSVEGFIADIEEFCHPTDENIQKLKETAVAEIDKIMLTDAPVLFPPGQLALGALQSSNEVHRVLDFERYTEAGKIRQSMA